MGLELNLDDEGKETDPQLRVCMLGLNGTGKTALVSQFLTSEYMNTYDVSLGKLKSLLGKQLVTWLVNQAVALHFIVD